MNLTGAYRGSRRRSECRCNSEDTVYVYIYIFDPVIDFLLHYTPLLHWLPIITFIIQFISPTLRQILWCVAQRWSVAGWCRIRGRLNRQPLIMGVCEVAKLLSLSVPYHYSMVGVIRALWTRDNRLSIECQRQSTLFNLAYPGTALSRSPCGRSKARQSVASSILQ